MGMGWPENSTTPFAYEAITVAGTAVGFTTGTASPQAGPGATRAFLTLETAEVRWRSDGTAPTASEGHLMAAGDSLTLEGPGAISQFRAIRTTATSGTLRVTYER